MFPPESLASRGMPSYLEGVSVKNHFLRVVGIWSTGARDSCRDCRIILDEEVHG